MSGNSKRKKRWPGRKSSKPYEKAVLVEDVALPYIWSLNDEGIWSEYYVGYSHAPEPGSIVVLRSQGILAWKIIK